MCTYTNLIHTNTVIASGGAEAISKYLKAGACDCINSPVCPELLRLRTFAILENIQLKVFSLLQ